MSPLLALKRALISICILISCAFLGFWVGLLFNQLFDIRGWDAVLPLELGALLFGIAGVVGYLKKPKPTHTEPPSV